MRSLRDFTIKTTRDALLNKELSSFELTKEFLEFIEKKDHDIRAYLEVYKDDALEQANTIDRKIAAGDDPGPLAGVPFAIKDNLVMRGKRTTAGSRVLEKYRGVYQATVIDNLHAAGAITLGKTNLDEFAMGSSTENSAFQITVNPHDAERVPGGSSGGSAAAVAAHESVAALGSDTGGSIRQPAAFCGIVGFKPTYGAVSRYGLIAMASSLDQVGPFAKTVEDVAIITKEIAGKDIYDATSVDVDYADLDAPLDLERVKGLTVGVPKEYFSADVDPLVQKGIEQARKALESLGVMFKEVSLPHTKHATSTYYIVMPAEVSSNLARFDGIRYSRLEDLKARNLEQVYTKQRTRGFGKEVQRRVVLGTFVLSSGYYDEYYAQAQKVRHLMKQDFDVAFENVDVLFAPVTPTPAFKIGEKTEDPLEMYLSDIFTTPANLAGIPALSIPVRDMADDELPVGFQLMGQRFRDKDVLDLGRLYDALYSD